jgi:hypothetical protein
MPELRMGGTVPPLHCNLHALNFNSVHKDIEFTNIFQVLRPLLIWRVWHFGIIKSHSIVLIIRYGYLSSHYLYLMHAATFRCNSIIHSYITIVICSLLIFVFLRTNTLSFIKSTSRSSLCGSLFPAHCEYRVLLLHLTILSATYTLGKTPLGEGSARRRDLYLTTHSIHKRQTTMHLAGIEVTIPASERLHTYALDRTAARIGQLCIPVSNSPK